MSLFLESASLRHASQRLSLMVRCGDVRSQNPLQAPDAPARDSFGVLSAATCPSLNAGVAPSWLSIGGRFTPSTNSREWLQQSAKELFGKPPRSGQAPSALQYKSNACGYCSAWLTRPSGKHVMSETDTAGIIITVLSSCRGLRPIWKSRTPTSSLHVRMSSTIKGANYGEWL